MTTDEFDTEEHDYGLAAHPDRIARDMSCNLTLYLKKKNQTTSLAKPLNERKYAFGTARNIFYV